MTHGNQTEVCIDCVLMILRRTRLAQLQDTNRDSRCGRLFQPIQPTQPMVVMASLLLQLHRRQFRVTSLNQPVESIIITALQCVDPLSQTFDCSYSLTTFHSQQHSLSSRERVFQPIHPSTAPTTRRQDEATTIRNSKDAFGSRNSGDLHS